MIRCYRRQIVGGEDIPLVPFYARSSDERRELCGQRTARESDGKAALLFNGLFLCLDYEIRERIVELGGGGKRMDDGSGGRTVGHSVRGIER